MESALWMATAMSPSANRFHLAMLAKTRQEADRQSSISSEQSYPDDNPVKTIKIVRLVNHARNSVPVNFVRDENLYSLQKDNQ